MAPHAPRPSTSGTDYRHRSASVSSEASSYSSSSSSSTDQLGVIRKVYSRSGKAVSGNVTTAMASEMASAGLEVSWTPQTVSPGEPATAHAPNGGIRKRTVRRRRLTQPKVKRARSVSRTHIDQALEVDVGPRGTNELKHKIEYKPRKDAIAKALREEASKADFPLSTLEWSRWKKAAQRKHPGTASWEPRFDGHPGVRHTAPFEDTTTPAVYEVAVKVPDHKEKIPVLASVKQQGINGQSWEAALLSKDKLRSQVDRVLRRGCKLYVRRAPFSVRDTGEVYRTCAVQRKAGGARCTQGAVNELRGLMARVCDYAWRDHYHIDTRTYSHRGLVVNGVKVSD